MKNNFTRLLCLTLIGLLSLSVAYSQEEEVPNRVKRNFAISSELAWNGLTGLGIQAIYFPIPHLAIDGGLGLSTFGLKLGARARYLFTKKKFTPYVGLGIMTTPNSIENVELEDQDTGEYIYLDSEPSSFIQFVGGGELVTGSGFLFGFNLGWAHSVNEENYVITSGTPSEDMQTIIDWLYGSGLVIGLNFGWAF